MVSIKIDFKFLKIFLIFGIIFLLFYSMMYKPITYPSINYISTDSPYLSPEGWPLPYPSTSYK